MHTVQKCWIINEKMCGCGGVNIFFPATLHLFSLYFHSHTEVLQSNLSQFAAELPTQTDQCGRILWGVTSFGELLPLRAPVINAGY